MSRKGAIAFHHAHSSRRGRALLLLLLLLLLLAKLADPLLMLFAVAAAAAGRLLYCATQAMIILDQVIGAIFLVELVANIISYDAKPLHFFRDGWNCLDFVIGKGHHR